MSRLVSTQPGGSLRTRWDQLLPPPPSAWKLARMRSRQWEIIAKGTPDNVACQLGKGRVIAKVLCLTRQFKPSCIGCLAPCRLCHHCRLQRVAFQDIELCRTCLPAALEQEVTRGMPVFPAGLQVYCQRTRVSIACADCVKLQSHQSPDEEECLWCQQPTYRCQRCGLFPSRYPNQGLCLHCMVAEYDGVVEDPKIEAFIMRMRTSGVTPRPPASEAGNSGGTEDDADKEGTHGA